MYKHLNIWEVVHQLQVMYLLVMIVMVQPKLATIMCQLVMELQVVMLPPEMSGHRPKSLDDLSGTWSHAALGV